MARSRRGPRHQARARLLLEASQCGGFEDVVRPDRPRPAACADLGARKLVTKARPSTLTTVPPGARSLQVQSRSAPYLSARLLFAQTPNPSLCKTFKDCI